MKRVVCIGSATVDVIVKSNDFRVLKSHQVTGGVALCEVYGGKTEVKDIKVAVGGAGTNVAVGLSRLGMTTSTIVRVGDDMWGQQIINDLKKEGVDVSLVQTDTDEQTAISVVLVASDGGRSILTDRGASSEISSQELDWETLKKADWIQLSSLGGKMELLENVISWAYTNQIPVGINPGKKELAEKSRLLKLLTKVELLVVNKTEAASLVDGEMGEMKTLANELLQLGIKKVAITDGKHGAGVADAGRWLEFSAFKVKSEDDTGAGDAFCAGLTAGIVRGWELDQALKLGLANGASEVTRLGVKDGLLYEKEVDKWMKKPLKLIEEKLPNAYG